MRRRLTVLVWLLVAGAAAGSVWVVRNPWSPRLDPLLEWPGVGLLIEDLRHVPGPPPFDIPEEGDGAAEEPAAELEPRLRRPGRAPGRGAPVELPPGLEPEGVERIVVKPGTLLRREPRPGAETVAALPNVGILKVVDRQPGWVKVLYRDAAGWVPDPGWSGAEPVLGSDPDPVRPLAGRAPDPEKLARARARLATSSAADTAGRLGPYLLFTDAGDPERLALLDRVAAGLEETYRARYGVSPVGEAAEAVVLFARESDYRAYLEEVSTLADLPSSGHTAFGIVSLFDGGRPVAEIGATLVHELAHLLNRRAIGPALPSWLDEGIADDLSQSRIEPSGRLVPGTLGGITVREGRRITRHGARAALQNLAEAAESGRLPSLPALLSLDWDEFVRRDAALHYAQASFFVRYLLQGEGGALAPGFRAFLREVSEGAPPTPELLRQRLGRPWPALEAGFRLWLAGQRGD